MNVLLFPASDHTPFVKKHRSSRQTTETLSDQGTKPETSSGGKQRKQSAQIEYDAANSVSASATGASYSSTSDSENAVLVSGDKVTLSGVTVDKTGGASGDTGGIDLNGHTLYVGGVAWAK